MARKLKNMKIEEVSLVKNPASRRLFFFKKALANMKKPCFVCPSCGYKRTGRGGKCKCGATMVSSKNKPEVRKMLDARLKDTHAILILKSFEEDEIDLEEIDFLGEYEELTGETMDEDQIAKAAKLPPKVLAAIKAAFKILNTYRDDLPDSVKSALALLGKYTAGKYPYPAPYKKESDDEMTEEEMEKAGKKISKANAAVLAKAIKDLTELLPEDFLKGMLEEEEGKGRENIVLTRLEKFMADLQPDDKNEEDKKEKDEKDEAEEDKEKEKDDGVSLESISKTLAEISDRLAVVERTKGVKKGIEEEDDARNENDSEDPFPSLPNLD